MPESVLVRSLPGYRYTQSVDNGRHRLLADEPESAGGDDRGPTPYEWLLGALGT